MSEDPMAASTDDLLRRLRGFQGASGRRPRPRLHELLDGTRHASALFIGCSDLRVVPHLLTGTGPGELLVLRNIGALVPRCGCTEGDVHATAATLEYALVAQQARHIVVCGHSRCGAMRSLYGGVPAGAPHLAAWLDLAREAVLPAPPDAQVLRRTEERSVVLQLVRLMEYPLVRERVQAGELALHGWHYDVDDGEVRVYDAESGEFVPASRADPEPAAAYARRPGAHKPAAAAWSS
jgi:carbonic anhydrase